jgi:hypothetical protein
MSSEQQLPLSAKVMTRGVIADLRTQVWLGDMGAGAKSIAGLDFALGKDLKNLLPTAYLKNIRSLMNVRRRAFLCYTLDCKWGRFMPAQAIEKWMKIDQEFSIRLSELRDSIIADHIYIIDSVKVRARKQAIELWKKRGNKGEPTVPFCMSIENLLAAQVPSQDEMKQDYRFYTDYYSVPPVSFGGHVDDSVSEIMNAHYGPVLDNLGSVFVREILTDLKSRILEACDTLKKNEGKTTGKIRASSLRRFESFLEVLKVLWTSGDGKVDQVIIDLQRELNKCYTDHDLIVRKAESLAALASEKLNAVNMGL